MCGRWIVGIAHQLHRIPGRVVPGIQKTTRNFMRTGRAISVKNSLKSDERKQKATEKLAPGYVTSLFSCDNKAF
jgi:hypothetical protein